MGRELACTVQYRDQTVAGKALLETAELVFRSSARGALRLVIRFDAMRSVEAADGRLTVRFGDESACFELGAQAAKWAERILHPPGRLDKLGLKAGVRWRWLGPQDDDFAREAEAGGAVSAADGADVTFLRAEERAALGHLAGLSVPLWIVYPRGVTSIREADVLAAGRAAGLTDVKVVRWSDTHTALRFVRR